MGISLENRRKAGFKTEGEYVVKRMKSVKRKSGDIYFLGCSGVC